MITNSQSLFLLHGDFLLRAVTSSIPASGHRQSRRRCCAPNPCQQNHQTPQGVPFPIFRDHGKQTMFNRVHSHSVAGFVFSYPIVNKQLTEIVLFFYSKNRGRFNFKNENALNCPVSQVVLPWNFKDLHNTARKNIFVHCHGMGLHPYPTIDIQPRRGRLLSFQLATFSLDFQSFTVKTLPTFGKRSRLTSHFFLILPRFSRFSTGIHRCR